MFNCSNMKIIYLFNYYNGIGIDQKISGEIFFFLIIDEVEINFKPMIINSNNLRKFYLKNFKMFKSSIILKFQYWVISDIIRMLENTNRFLIESLTVYILKKFLLQLKLYFETNKFDAKTY